MIETDIPLVTRDGMMSAFTTRPDEGGPFPVVFFIGRGCMRCSIVTSSMAKQEIPEGRRNSLPHQ